MISTYHPVWQTSRVNFLIELYGKDFFTNKRILELAPFNGYIGYCFSQLGATVHGIEGRAENVRQIQTLPGVTVEQANLDTPTWVWGDWDIIINFGLYYHLEKYHDAHLTNCLRHCDIMFFETVIFDSDDCELHFRKEIGNDQSLSEVGGNPTVSYVENIFQRERVDFNRHDSRRLNGDYHCYDWVSTNSKKLYPYKRRFWITSKL
jgi:hypothetical protein